MDRQGVVQTLFRFEVLNRIPRTGFLMRGIDSPGSVGEHVFSSFVLGVLLLEDCAAEGLDSAKVLKMIALHETGEILTGDIPAPVTAMIGREKKSALELEAAKRVLKGYPGLHKLIGEFEEGVTPEARFTRAVDKLQMMIKVLLFESEGKGALDDFWNYEGNFFKPGIEAVDSLVDSIRSLRGNVRLDLLEVMTGDDLP